MGESCSDIRYGVGGLMWSNSRKSHSCCTLCQQNFFEHKAQLYKVNDAPWASVILRALGVGTKYLKSFLEKCLISPSIMQFNEFSAPPLFLAFQHGHELAKRGNKITTWVLEAKWEWGFPPRLYPYLIFLDNSFSSFLDYKPWLPCSLFLWK